MNKKTPFSPKFRIVQKTRFYPTGYDDYNDSQTGEFRTRYHIQHRRMFLWFDVPSNDLKRWMNHINVQNCFVHYHDAKSILKKYLQNRYVSPINEKRCEVKVNSIWTVNNGIIVSNEKAVPSPLFDKVNG